MPTSANINAEYVGLSYCTVQQRTFFSYYSFFYGHTHAAKTRGVQYIPFQIQFRHQLSHSVAVNRGSICTLRFGQRLEE